MDGLGQGTLRGQGWLPGVEHPHSGNKMQPSDFSREAPSVLHRTPGHSPGLLISPRKACPSWRSLASSAYHPSQLSIHPQLRQLGSLIKCKSDPI